MLNMFYIIAIAVSSVYVFPSGYPQPADFLLILCSAFVFLNVILNKKVSGLSALSPQIYIIIFILYSLLLSTIWAIKTQDATFFKGFSFYAFNGAIFLALTYTLRIDNNFHRGVLLSLYYASIVSAVGVVVSLGASVRPTGFFNNPNQLAFYSLLVWSCVLVLTKGKTQSSLFYWGSFISCGLGVFAAASLGAMSGFVVLVSVMLIRNLTGWRLIRALVGSIILAGLMATVFNQFVVSVISNVETRILRAETKVDDMYEERNYDRILAFPEYMLLGAGEARLDRFHPYDVNEIHSTLGNLIFSYGVIGFFSIAAAWFVALRRSPFYVWLIVTAPMLYSLSHMGLRTTMFWILLALIWHVHGQKSVGN